LSGTIASAGGFSITEGSKRSKRGKGKFVKDENKSKISSAGNVYNEKDEGLSGSGIGRNRPLSSRIVASIEQG
jgi:hypothetical protein